MKSPTPDLSEIAVSAQELAGILDLHERRVNRILAEHGAPRAKDRRRYLFVPALRILVAHFVAEAEDEFKQARTAIWTNRRHESDLALARKRGEYVAVVEVVATAVPFMLAIKQRLSRSSLTPTEREEMLADLAGLGAIDWTAKAKEAK